MSLPIHRISVPNPFFEGRNSTYLIRSDPLTLVDTGVATEKAYDRLCSGLAEVGVRPRDIRRVVLTHKHIDHIGNAWRFQQAGGAEVLIHESECKSVSEVDPSGRRFESMVRRKLEEWGVESQRFPESAGSQMPTWELESAAPTPLRDERELEFETGVLRVLHTPGHTMGSICLAGEGFVFVGDHVLEDTSPNVGAGDMRSSGMLARFLDSLARVCELGDVLVHPGHGESFRGLESRCRALTHHHRERLERTRQSVEGGANTVYEVAQFLFGTLDDFHVVLGCAEANAHIEWLVDDGQLRREGRAIALSAE